MPHFYLEQMSGSPLLNCKNDGVNITSWHKIISFGFHGQNGNGILCEEIVNTYLSDELFNKQFMTGSYHIRNVFCKVCKLKLGWYYEKAERMEEKYKEHKYVLELSYLEAEHNYYRRNGYFREFSQAALTAARTAARVALNESSLASVRQVVGAHGSDDAYVREATILSYGQVRTIKDPRENVRINREGDAEELCAVGGAQENPIAIGQASRQVNR